MNLIIFNPFRAVNNGVMEGPAPLANAGLGQGAAPPPGATVLPTAILPIIYEI